MHDNTDNKVVLIKRNTSLERKRADANRFQKLYEEALAIEAEDARKAGALGFIPRWLVHATLPYVQPKGNPPAWGRRSGNISLMIQPGYYMQQVAMVDKRGRKHTEDTPVSLGFPYGAYPRLVLAWIASEVVRTRQRDVVLGNSLAEFMSNIGKETRSGGSRGTITLLKQQMQRLFSAQIAVTNDPDALEWKNEGFRIADNANIEIWWNPLKPNQATLWESSLRLTEKFFETLVKTPVPVDLRIIKALSRSAMQMDIYCWLTYRAAMIERNVKVPWEALMQQFGSDANKYKFREVFDKNLKNVLVVYPQAKVSTDKSGILLMPSPPSIKRIARVIQMH